MTELFPSDRRTIKSKLHYHLKQTTHDATFLDNWNTHSYNMSTSIRKDTNNSDSEWPWERHGEKTPFTMVFHPRPNAPRRSCTLPRWHLSREASWREAQMRKPAPPTHHATTCPSNSIAIRSGPFASACEMSRSVPENKDMIST